MGVIKAVAAGCGLLLLLTVAAAAGKPAKKPIVIRFSHVVGENTPKGQGALMFKKLVEERLAGKVRVEVYPRSQKFNDDQVLLALLFGDVQMAAPSLAKFRSYAPAMQVFDLPFLFPDVEAIHRFQQAAVGRGLLDAMRPRGIQGLAYWDNGMRVISTIRPLRVPADAKGLVFRIEPSSVFQAQYARIGVATLQVPFKQVVDAIREGLVEGQENAWSNIYSRKIYTLHKNFTELKHSFLGYMVVTSTEFWNGLPADIRSALEAILAKVSEEVNRMAAEQAEVDRERIAAVPGVTIIRPTAEEMTLWHEAWIPIWELFEPQIGPEVLDAALAARKNSGE